MANKITYRIFVGDRPIEDLSENDLRAFKQRTAERMVNALNDFFTQRPEEFKRVLEIR